MPDMKRAPRPTMKDVAAQVGVSIKTVSRVLNGEAGASPRTTEAVLAVAHEIGFRRNDLARSLRRQNGADTIGVVAKNLSTRFFEGLIAGIEEVAAERDALVLVTAATSPEHERSALAALSSRRLDGVVLVPSVCEHSFLAAEQASGFPMVFVDSPATGIVADAVLADNRGGARAAVQHLLRHGHRSIAFVGSESERYTMHERIAGYREGLHPEVRCDSALVHLDCLSAGHAQAAVARWVCRPEPPTAVFAANSVCAIGAARALREAGLSHDVALVGFDDFEPADLLDPPLTVIAQNPDAAGRHAALALFRRIDGVDETPYTMTLPVTLVPRGSGEIRGPQPRQCDHGAQA